MESNVIDKVELPELRYEYQPTDDQGMNMGGPQVIKYKTTDELIAKLQENNVRLQRKLREANRKNKTGQLDPEEIPESARRFDEPVEFKPTTLTADELIEVARDMADPAKVEAAFGKLTQATFGAPVDKVRGAINAAQQAAIDAKIGREVDKFLVNNPDYYICRENWNTIYNWMQRFNLDPVEENFALAYRRLTDADILLTSGGTRTAPEQVNPVVPAQVNPAPQVLQEGPDVIIVDQPQTEVINFEPQPAAPRRVSTTLSNQNTTTAVVNPTTPGSDIVYVSPAVYNSKGALTGQPKTYVGLKAIDAMPPEEYRRRFNTERGFKEKVNELEKTRVFNKNQR